MRSYSISPSSGTFKITGRFSRCAVKAWLISIILFPAFA
nr:MAG TPA: hypothetical protein [Caudoviricetes sp.]